MSQQWKFIKYQSIYDLDVILYALEREAVEKLISGVKFIEVTPDFNRVLFVRLDSLKAVGQVLKTL